LLHEQLSCSAALSGQSPEAACGAPKARGLTANAQTESRMIEDMTVRNFVEKTHNDYIRHVRTFTAFLCRAPDTAAPEDLRLFQLHHIRRMQPWSSIAARHRLATLVLFRLGGGGNCGPLREHCSPVVDQALQSMRRHIQCGVIHRAFVAGSGFGAFPS
jgi:hypothetical protein